MYRFVGIDAHGTPRVFAEHENRDVAETMCRDEVFAYVRRRRDTGPISGWEIVKSITRHPE